VWSVNGVLSISSSPPSLGLAIVSVWPRLQSSQERPPWLRVDFDHWEELSDGEEGAEGGGEDDGDATTGHKKPLPRERLEEIKKKQAQMMSEMEKVKKEATQLWKTVDTAKKAYLLLYNGVQWAGFILIVMSLLKCLTKGREGISTAYSSTGSMLMFSQALMMLEILHSAFGLVKSGITTVFLQVFGRFLILFAVLGPSVEIHEHPIVYVLFLVWSLIEIFRYPYYALSVLGMEAKTLTWLRYTAWIPLYPLGFTSEATVLWLSIPHFKNSGYFQFDLPNPLNFSFDVVSLIWIAICCVPPIAFVEMRHMYSQMKKRLAKLKSE
jgi:very-long-chain (3R)-3-hydroxyacyl-CoA dehydratase